jgi:glycosyltransferase involved in cell wall biosynthesis
MKIILFNPLSELQVRGISKVADELVAHLSREGHKVIEIKIPKFLYPNSDLLRIMLLILYQQLVCPVIAIKNRADIIIDPYNGFSIIGSLLIKTKYFIHDYTPFKRKFWYLRAGTIYQLLMFKFDSWFSLAEVYHDSLDIETPNFLKRARPPKFFPCIVDALDRANSSFFDDEVRPLIASLEGDILIISTISGPGWNKDFSGLLGNLKKINQRFVLIAFGFGDKPNTHEEVVMENGDISLALIVGFVDESSISSTIIKSDLFVFHSLSEGFGRPILEALHLGKNIVTTLNAPVLSILSDEAMSNIFVYESSKEFLTAIEQAKGSSFKPYSRIYRSDVNDSIQSLLS